MGTWAVSSLGSYEQGCYGYSSRCLRRLLSSTSILSARHMVTTSRILRSQCSKVFPTLRQKETLESVW